MARTVFEKSPEWLRRTIGEIAKKGDPAEILNNRIAMYRNLVLSDMSMVASRLAMLGCPPLPTEDPVEAVWEMEDRKYEYDARMHGALSLLRTDAIILFHAEQASELLRQEAEPEA